MLTVVLLALTGVGFRQSEVLSSSRESYTVNPLPELSYFETEEDINKWKLGEGVTLELSEEHVTQGKYSGKLAFSMPLAIRSLNCCAWRRRASISAGRASLFSAMSKIRPMAP